MASINARTHTHTHTHIHHPPMVTHSNNPPPSHCLIAGAIRDLFQAGVEGEEWGNDTAERWGFYAG